MQVPFILAPMAEISHRALRELIEGFGGCDSYFSEMISSSALTGGGPFEAWYTDNGPRPEKLVFQLVGSDIGQIVKAAALLDRLECAGIDINMGCCAPLIRKTGAGIAWMASIDRAGELVGRVRQAVKHRLSVKLRLGFNEDFDYLARFCRRLEAEGVEFITLHPRTASEKFKRVARWQYVGALRRELGIPVAGNGDISSVADLLRRLTTESGQICDAVMIGRAAVHQPWIFAQARMESRESGVGFLSDNQSPVRKTFNSPNNNPIPHPPFPDPYSLILCTGLRFLELLTRFQPPEFHISRARRFFSFFCDNLKWGNYLKNLLNREESLEGIERVWQGYFRDYGEEEKPAKIINTLY
jgi:tRNA-dihydrouridine synthase